MHSSSKPIKAYRCCLKYYKRKQTLQRFASSNNPLNKDKCLNFGEKTSFQHILQGEPIKYMKWPCGHAILQLSRKIGIYKQSTCAISSHRYGHIILENVKQQADIWNHRELNINLKKNPICVYSVPDMIFYHNLTWLQCILV